ncbi:MAG: hypothetical protein R3C71_00510 [Candidatus Krumholzibacteriia bacterium]|nr:hypothetical protein [Candidatus Latescibacterota bacterium]
MRFADARRRWALLALLALLTAQGAMAAVGDEPAPKVTEQRLELRTITYHATLSRDPFDLPDYTAGSQTSSRELDLRTAELVGVVKLPGGDYIALVEDANGDSYALFKGDNVRSGRVTAISDAALTAWMRNGDSRQQIRLELVKEGE